MVTFYKPKIASIEKDYPFDDDKIVNYLEEISSKPMFQIMDSREKAWNLIPYDDEARRHINIRAINRKE